jgi:hypothetical protein
MTQDTWFLWKWEGWRWFNVGGPVFVINGTFIQLWNAFHKDSTAGRFWGFGILQIGHRHLFAVGFSGVSILFIGRIP